MNIFKKIYADLCLYVAVNSANKAHDAGSGDRYYVVPTSNGKLIIMNFCEFYKYRQRGYIDESATIKELESQCFYYTTNLGGIKLSEVEKSEKQQMYFNWVESGKKSSLYVKI